MKIQELFDTGKRLDRKIESVVTFADHSAEDLKSEINEYIVTDKLRDSYNDVIDRMQTGFMDAANEVGIWVSGFYGSGKSSFAKYLGYSFDTSLVVDGMSFGEKLMNRIDEPGIKAMHNTIVKQYNPMVVMIDLTTQAQVGKKSNVSDIIYYETLKSLGVSISSDAIIIDFNALLRSEGRYEEFTKLLKERKGKDWEGVQRNALIAKSYASELAHEMFPDIFISKDSLRTMSSQPIENEQERVVRLIELVKQKTDNDKVLFILDEVGGYVSHNEDLITNLQGLMQILKDQFKGKVWLIGTAQQTLTEDNPNAQLNSNRLYILKDRFPIKVDIEAEDIKEIITKRLLGKSADGKKRLQQMFNASEGSIKMNTKLTITNARSRYIQPIESGRFADLYPFLPVHIDILLALLQKLASRTGGVGLRSVIRLIRDILVDNKLADENLGILANPSHFYDVLRPDMEKNSDYKEIVIATRQAANLFQDNSLAVALCKTIAVMQILDDFPLTFENICALLYKEIGKDTDKSQIRKLLNEIKATPGVTLEEVEGQFRFMTNAILSVKEERGNMTIPDQKRDYVLRELVKDILSPAPQVQIFGSKTIKPGVELTIGRRTQSIIPGDNLKINLTFVESPDFESKESKLRADSTEKQNERVMFMISTLTSPIEGLLNEIVRDEAIAIAHANDNNKEVRDYIKSQEEDAKAKKQEVHRLLQEAMNNSESIWRGQTEAVDSQTYVSKSLRKFAEKTFEKYSFAPKAVNTNSVRDIAKYDNWASLPDSLNPFGLVGSDGSINTSADALREVLEYISAKDPDGSKLLNDFEAAPYGWAKDTTRYLVALLLKGNKIIIRAGAKVFKMLTDKAAEAMKNNVQFGHVSISRNNDRQLNPKEFLKAKNNIVALFNSPNVALTFDSIAKAAFKAMTNGFKEDAESLAHDYQETGMAGGDIVNKAINFAKRIVSSEGSDAPVLLSQDDECFKAMKYVLDVRKNGVLSTVKTIRQRFKDISTLTDLPQLKAYFSEINNLRELYNSLLEDSNCVANATEFSDIYSKINSLTKQACADFCFEQNKNIKQDIDAKVASYDTDKLTEEQMADVQTQIGRIRLSEGDGTIGDLRAAINEYNLAFNPSGSIYKVSQTIVDYLIANEPKPEDYGKTSEKDEPKYGSEGTDGTGDGGSETKATGEDSKPKEYKIPKRTPVSVRRSMKKADVESFISRLKDAISDMDDIDTVELNLF